MKMIILMMMMVLVGMSVYMWRVADDYQACRNSGFGVVYCVDEVWG